jgi:hypothetical protein
MAHIIKGEFVSILQWRSYWILNNFFTKILIKLNLKFNGYWWKALNEGDLKKFRPKMWEILKILSSFFSLKIQLNYPPKKNLEGKINWVIGVHTWANNTCYTSVN